MYATGHYPNGIRARLGRRTCGQSAVVRWPILSDAELTRPQRFGDRDVSSVDFWWAVGARSRAKKSPPLPTLRDGPRRRLDQKSVHTFKDFRKPCASSIGWCRSLSRRSHPTSGSIQTRHAHLLDAQRGGLTEKGFRRSQRRPTVSFSRQRRLRRNYSSPEVALTGLSARSCQFGRRWSDLAGDSVGTNRGPPGGLHRRRYTPIELFDCWYSRSSPSWSTVPHLHAIVNVLRHQFRVRLFEATGARRCCSCSDGARFTSAHLVRRLYNLLEAPTPPLLVMRQRKGCSRN